MSRIYDNWEKLVGAVLRREKDRQLAFCESFSSSYSFDLSSRFSFEIPSAVDDHLTTEFSASSRAQNLFVSWIEYEEIRKATINFLPSNMLGEGPFSCVYKGWIDEHFSSVKLESGIAVAVKILNNTKNFKPKKWVNGINCLSHLRHPNLLIPMAYSFGPGKRILVYEFMPNGSLDNHLFRQYPLPWSTRIKVAIGAARALAFLHGLEIPVIYRILKSDNIILDGDFNVKLSNIGLGKDVSGHKIEGPLTLLKEVDLHGPYAAPEYIKTGMSTECDVYSFGVVLVELMSGRRALEKNTVAEKHYSMDWAKPYLVHKRKLLQIMDRRLKGQYPREQAYEVGKIAFRCVNSDPISRPTMTEVVVELQKL